MTTFLLIRHGSNDVVGRRIAGRSPGIKLNVEGRRQAEALAERLAPPAVRLAAVYSSPLERTRETAAPLAERQGLPVETLEGVVELDFGEWTGRSLEELRTTPGWTEFNTYRSGTRIPGGELLLEVQRRVVVTLERLRERHGEAAVAVVSHGDVIRAALCYYLGVPLDLLQRLEVSPGSMSALQLEPWGPRLHRLNDTGGPFRP